MPTLSTQCRLTCAVAAHAHVMRTVVALFSFVLVLLLPYCTPLCQNQHFSTLISSGMACLNVLLKAPQGEKK